MSFSGLAKSVSLPLISITLVCSYFTALNSSKVPPVKERFEDVSQAEDSAVTKGKLQVLNKQVQLLAIYMQAMVYMYLMQLSSSLNRKLWTDQICCNTGKLSGAVKILLWTF